MAKNEAMEKHEEFKAEFKKRVKEQAKMLYRKSLDEISDRHKFVCVAYAVKHMMRRMLRLYTIYQWNFLWAVLLEI